MEISSSEAIDADVGAPANFLQSLSIRSVAIGLALAVGLYTVWMFAQFRGHQFTEGVLSFYGATISLFAGACCFYGLRRPTRRQRISWRLLGLMAIGYAICDVDLGWYQSIKNVVLVTPPVFESVIGAGCGVAAVAALLYMPSPRFRLTSQTRSFTDGVILAGSMLMIGWVAISGQSYDVHKGGVRVLLDALIPGIATILLVTLATSVAIRWRGKSRRTMVFVTLAAACVGVSAAFYAYYGLKQHYSVPPYASIGYRVGFALLALAALQPITDEDEVVAIRTPLTGWQIVTPYAYAIVGLGFAGYALLRHQHSDVVVVVLTILLLCGIIWRQILVIFENKHLTDELDSLAFSDPLTGLGNRAVLDRTLAIWQGGRSDADGLAIMVLDLDKFKNVNDTLGHPVGDELLKIVGQRITSCVRQGDAVIRTGGDEFAVLYDQPATHDDLAEIGRRLVASLTEPIAIGNHVARIGASIGIAIRHNGVESSTELMRQVDAALYTAKRAGGSAYRFFDDVMTVEFVERLQLEAELGLALEAGELFLTYQPIIDLRDGTISGAEALLRWNHPRLGVLLPASFLSIAEDTGAIVPIGRWVLHEALRQSAVWRLSLAGAEEFRISVNMSAKQISAGNMAEMMTTFADEFLGLSSVHVELTESMLIDQSEATNALLEASQRLGMSLSLDDFGTGYSSLSYLRQLPIGSLKIDRSFVSGLGLAESESVIVEAIINLAHALHLEVIAEGIETELQLMRLRALGCEFGQGHLWSVAVTAGEFEDWWTANIDLLARSAEST